MTAGHRFTDAKKRYSVVAISLRIMAILAIRIFHNPKATA